MCVPIQEPSSLVDSHVGRTYLVRHGIVRWKELLKKRPQESCVHTHIHTGLLGIYVTLLIQWRHVDRHLYCYWSMRMPYCCIVTNPWPDANILQFRVVPVYFTKSLYSSLEKLNKLFESKHWFCTNNKASTCCVRIYNIVGDYVHVVYVSII